MLSVKVIGEANSTIPPAEVTDRATFNGELNSSVVSISSRYCLFSAKAFAVEVKQPIEERIIAARALLDLYKIKEAMEFKAAPVVARPLVIENDARAMANAMCRVS